MALLFYQINKSIPSTLAILKMNHQISPSKMFFSFIILWISSQSQEICSLFLVSPLLLVFCPICAIHITTPIGQIKLYNLVQYIFVFQKTFSFLLIKNISLIELKMQDFISENWERALVNKVLCYSSLLLPSNCSILAN